MILHFYFARRFTAFFIRVFVLFFLFLFLFDLVSQLRSFSSIISFREVFILTLLKTPEVLYQMMPLIMIISAAAVYISLSRSNELVISRNTGRSAMQALIGPMVVTIFLGGMLVTVFNPIVSATSALYLDLKDSYSNQRRSVISIGAEGLWLRQGNENGQTVIRAERANFDGSVLYGVSMLEHHPDGGPKRRIEANSASLQGSEWWLNKTKVWPLISGINAEENAREHEWLRVPSNLTTDQIQDRFGKPSTVSFWALPVMINQLKSAGFSARRHEVWYQTEIARPLFLVAMVLIGAAFTMGHSRQRSMGLGVLMAILLGFGLFYVRNFAQILAENGQLPVTLAAWAPPLAALFLGLGILFQAEEG